VRHSGHLLRLLGVLAGIEFHDGSEHPKFRTQAGRIVVDEEFGGE
jgi:hypothetical protein